MNDRMTKKELENLISDFNFLWLQKNPKGNELFLVHSVDSMWWFLAYGGEHHQYLYSGKSKNELATWLRGAIWALED